MTEREVESRDGTVWDAAMAQARAEGRAEALAEVVAKLDMEKEACQGNAVRAEALAWAIATVREMGEK